MTTTTLATTTVDDFRDSLLNRGRAEKTANIYAGQIRRMMMWSTTTTAQIGAEADTMARWINQGREAGDGAGLTRQKIAAARAYLQWRGVDLGPLADYKAPPLPAPAPHPLPGGMDDVDRMVKQAQAENIRPWLPAAIALGGYAGLRVSEARSVTWSNLDRSRRELTVRGKGDKTRVVPVSQKLLKVLDGIPPADRNGPICQGVSDSVTRKLITRIAYDLGIDDVSSHDLRATFATSLFRATKDILLVSRLLGHSNIATTQAYLHFDNAAAATAVDCL